MWGGRFLCRAYQHIEQKFTLAASVALGEIGVDTQMLVYDGLAIANSDVSQPHILKVAANVCERLCPGIDMQWSFKEHDFSIKDADDKKIGVFDIRNCERRPVMVSTEVTPESLAKLGPVFKFDTNFRCKCPKLAELLSSIRDMIDSNATPNQMYRMIKTRLDSSNILACRQPM